MYQQIADWAAKHNVSDDAAEELNDIVAELCDKAEDIGYNAGQDDCPEPDEE